MKKRVLALMLAGCMLAPAGIPTTVFADPVTVESDQADADNNGTAEKADEIAVNTEIKGSLTEGKKGLITSNSSDIDWFKTMLTEDGYFNVEFAALAAAEKADLKNGFKFSIYVNDLSQPVYVVGAINSINKVITGNLPYPKGSVVYVKVEPENSAISPIGYQYSLKVNNLSDESWEKEGNDTAQTATEITKGKAVLGNLAGTTNVNLAATNTATVTDVDYYKFIAPENGYYNLKMTVNDPFVTSVLNGWTVNTYIINDTIQELTFADGTKYCDFDLTNKESTSELALKKGSIVFFEVCAKNKYSGPANVDYKLTVSKTSSFAPSKTSISKLTPLSKSFKVMWAEKKTKTTGYQLQYSTSSKFKGAKTVSTKSNVTVTKTVKGLKAKKKYYVRVRTYEVVNGSKYYSAWSKVKTVTTKK